MKDKINLGIICGGKSAEHEVSLLSAQNVYQELDRQKYNVTLLFIGKDGKWYLPSSPAFLYDAKTKISPLKSFEVITRADTKKIDVIFPVLHGTYGEDGAIQGMLTLLNIAFVGSGVLGATIGMDKDVTKRLLHEQGMSVVSYEVIRTGIAYSEDEIIKKLGLPLFVKPANLGSSIGVTKVKKKEELKAAIDLAFSYDLKVIVEKYIKGREIACGILGNGCDITVSVLGEIKPHHEFYTYEAKYIDPEGATYTIPANLPSKLTEKIQYTAKKVFSVLEASGMARIDFFVTDDGQFFVNEINTIPGFTKNSMYPRLFNASGISYSELIDRLVNEAISRHETQNSRLRQYIQKVP